MEFSLKKYLSMALRWLIPFVILELIIFVLYFTNIALGGIFAIVNLADIVCLLIPGIYYLIMFFVFKGKCKGGVPAEGVITNWSAGFWRYTGGVIIECDGKEYSTSAYFRDEECKGLVGKSVSYAIINETLFIYEIKE